MKSKSVLPVLIAFAAFSHASAYADNCRGKLCVGGWVVDPSNYIGQITGFHDEQGTAVYSVGSSQLEASCSALKAEVPVYNGIVPRREVVDASNYVGVVLHVFEDGRTQYQVGTSLMVSSSVSPQVDQISLISSGVIVVDSSNYVGAALAVFSDGRVQYTVGTSILVSHQVVGEIAELNGAKAGIAVVDPSNYVGIALHVFRDGRVQYHVGTSDLVSSQIQPEIASFGKISQGVYVVDSSNYVGVCEHVFADGRVNYQVGTSEMVSRQVKGEFDGCNGIHAGDVVVDASNYVGKASHVFEDGRVSYGVGTSSLVSQNVSPAVPVLNGVKAGSIVLDSSDYVGTVENVFRDGRVNYQVGTSQMVGSRISKEVDSNPLYEKGKTYATASFQIGSPIRFFENQAIQLQELNGATSIARTLYPPVSQVDSYQVGSVIADSETRAGTVTMVFENGTLGYALKDPKNDTEKNEVFSAKIWGFFYKADPKALAELQKNEQMYWLYDLASALSTGEDDQAGWLYGSPYPVAVDSTQLPAVKKDLSARLSAEPGLIHDAKVLKLVQTYLAN